MNVNNTIAQLSSVQNALQSQSIAVMQLQQQLSDASHSLVSSLLLGERLIMTALMTIHRAIREKSESSLSRCLSDIKSTAKDCNALVQQLQDDLELMNSLDALPKTDVFTHLTDNNTLASASESMDYNHARTTISEIVEDMRTSTTVYDTMAKLQDESDAAIVYQLECRALGEFPC